MIEALKEVGNRFGRNKLATGHSSEVTAVSHESLSTAHLVAHDYINTQLSISPSWFLPLR